MIGPESHCKRRYRNFFYQVKLPRVILFTDTISCARGTERNRRGEGRTVVEFRTQNCMIRTVVVMKETWVLSPNFFIEETKDFTRMTLSLSADVDGLLLREFRPLTALSPSHNIITKCNSQHYKSSLVFCQAWNRISRIFIPQNFSSRKFAGRRFEKITAVGNNKMYQQRKNWMLLRLFGAFKCALPEFI